MDPKDLILSGNSKYLNILVPVDEKKPVMKKKSFDFFVLRSKYVTSFRLRWNTAKEKGKDCNFMIDGSSR